ncbi:hypothetical protein CHARACLAT_018080, partial [Characodon lateralis]|nr:hypothetical protein [Characodon lateralis]
STKRRKKQKLLLCSEVVGSSCLSSQALLYGFKLESRTRQKRVGTQNGLGTLCIVPRASSSTFLG